MARPIVWLVGIRTFNRLSESVSNFSGNLDAIDKQFEEITSLQKEDYIFIVFCAALQAYRQYFVTDFKPPDFVIVSPKILRQRV